MWPINDSEPSYFDRNNNVRRTSSNIWDAQKSENAPTEPVTLAQAKVQCRIDFTDDDTFVTQLITQCRRMVEAATGISLVAKTVVATMDLLTEIEIPYGPVISITSFVDKNGNAITTDQYELTGSLFKRLNPTNFLFYKSVLTYSAGYGSNQVEPDLCLAILNEIAFRYEQRGETGDTRKSVNPGICEAAQVLCDPYKRLSWA